VDHAFSLDTVLTSRRVLSELEEVLQRPKFARAKTLAERQELLRHYTLAFDPIDITHTVTGCRDPRDNIVLELALSGYADLIVTGDLDLLALRPWRGIAILTPADYLTYPRT
jgi:hypothetical protein